MAELEWSPDESAQAYRLTVVEPGTGEEVFRSEELKQPRCALDDSLLGDGPLTARLELQRGGRRGWDSAGPEASVPLAAPGARTSRLSWEGAAPIHRLTVFDRTAAQLLFDQPVLGCSYPLPWPRAEESHDLVMRVRAWRDGSWEELGDWRPLPLEIVMGEPREPPPLAPGLPLGLALLFTIDTEASLLRQRDPDPERVIDELIFGDFGDGAANGVGLHMDLLEHFGHRGCFFVDVLMEYQFGPEALQRTIEGIASRGHEVQLHVHADHLAFSSDPKLSSLAGGLAGKDADGFRRIMELSVELFERRSGKRPLAYRAGGFRIAEPHFGVLAELGIAVDSSLHTLFRSKVPDWMKTRTQPFWVDGVLEVPVTWLMVRDDRSAPNLRGFYPNAINGDPVSRMPAPAGGPPRVATYVSHSFELMRADRDAGPERVAAFKQRLRDNLPAELVDRLLEQMGPEVRMRIYDGDLDDGRVSAAAGLLRRIADRPDARCVTYAELAESRELWREPRREPVDPVPTLDRQLGVASVTATRIYTGALASELGAVPPPAEAGDAGNGAEALLSEAPLSWPGLRVGLAGAGSERLAAALERRGVAAVLALESGGERARELDVVIWPSGLERCRADAFERRLRDAAGLLGAEGVLLARIGTLGLGAGRAAGLPPLAELLFARSELARGEPGDSGAPQGEPGADAIAWDGATFAAWFAQQGWELLQLRRLPRDPAGREALDRFPDKLGSLAREELETAAVDVALRRPPDSGRRGRKRRARQASTREGGADRDPAELRELAERFGVGPGDAVLELRAERRRRSLEPEGYDVAIAAGGLGRLAPLELDRACEEIRLALRPGGQLLLRAPLEGPVATPTTLLVALLRAGFELIETADGPAALDCRLVRPLGLDEIARFAGQL